MRKSLTKHHFAKLALAGGLILAPSFVAADDEAEAFVEALVGAGCVLHPDNIDSIVAASGLTMDEAAGAWSQLSQYGQVVEQGQMTIFKSEACTAAPLDKETERFVEVVRQNGCAIRQSDAAKVLIPAGFEKDAVNDHLGRLLAKDMIEINGGEITLITEGCR